MHVGLVTACTSFTSAPCMLFIYRPYCAAVQQHAHVQCALAALSVCLYVISVGEREAFIFFLYATIATQSVLSCLLAFAALYHVPVAEIAVF